MGKLCQWKLSYHVLTRYSVQPLDLSNCTIFSPIRETRAVNTSTSLPHDFARIPTSRVTHGIRNQSQARSSTSVPSL